MSATATRRRRRTVLVPLLGMGVAAWVVHRRLGARPHLESGWPVLPPAPHTSAPSRPPVPAPPVEHAADRPPADVSPEGARPADGSTEPAAGEPPAGVVSGESSPDSTHHSPAGVPARADGSSPDPGYTVKGKAATKVFHAPGGPYYSRTRADLWFRTADDARAAGFTERTRRQA
jgi:hypothetical protein